MKHYMLSLLLLGTTTAFALQRPSTDTKFGESGMLKLNKTNFIKQVTVLPDNKILFLGTYQNGTTKCTALYKTDSNGTPDAAFGNNGVVADTFQHDDFCKYSSFRVQPDGHLFLANLSDATQHILCYKSDGSYENTVGTKGLVTLGSLQYVSAPRAVAFCVCADNQFVVAYQGFSTFDGLRKDGYSLVRYDATGKIDKSFGREGYAVFSYTDKKFLVSDLQALSDGSILCAGSDGTLQKNYRTAIIKLNSSGTPDNSFGTNGTALVDATTETETDMHDNWYTESAGQLSVQADGKIILSSLSGRPGKDFVVRLLASGAPDTSFGKNGISEGMTDLMNIKVLKNGLIVAGNKNSLRIIHSNHYDSIPLPDTQATLDCIDSQADSAVILCSSTVVNQEIINSIVRINLGSATEIIVPARNTNISIYPNPVKDILHIESNAASIKAYTVYDLNGHSLLTGKTNQPTVDVQWTLPAGLYFCKIQTDKETKILRIQATAHSH